MIKFLKKIFKKNNAKSEFDFIKRRHEYLYAVDTDVEDYPSYNHNNKFFKWSQVMDCWNETLLYNEIRSRKFEPCPNCGKSHMQLRWIMFDNWKKAGVYLAGRKGPLSICEDCKKQVQFVVYIMN